MPPSSSTPPVATSPLTHVRRAFGWNLGRVQPSVAESDALAAAGVTDPVVQRYAAWRRSLMRVAIVPTLLVLGLALVGAIEDGMEELSAVGVALECAWMLAMAGLAVACVQGIRAWRSPGASSTLLAVAWAVGFVVPIAYALLPAGVVFTVHATSAGGGVVTDRLGSLLDIALELALSGGAFLTLLPSVLSVIPGAVNGCLRIKSLLPAAQLPGWLLVCAAPVFLLFWLVILVVANRAFQSPLLVCGILLWAGSPIWYALRGPVFVRSQITDEDASKIGRVKRVVGLLSLAGVVLIVAFATTSKIAGLTVVGMDPHAAVSNRIEELADASTTMDVEAVREVLDHSMSIVYAYDLSSYQLVVDFLAKLLLVTAVFADLVLRATLVAWRNDRALRGRAEASGYDASAAATAAALAEGREAAR